MHLREPDGRAWRASGAFETMEALRVVLQEEQTHAMSDVLVQLERARMEREDFRQGGGPSNIWASPGEVAPLSLLRYVENLQDTAEDLLEEAESDESDESEERD